jgi:uncharacterized membrane protein
LAIQTNRTLGVIGTCFTLIGAVSGIFSLIHFAYPNSTAATLLYSGASIIVGFLALIGFILFLVAMNGFSKDYGEHKIFSYILWGIIITIVAEVIVGLSMILIFFANITRVISGMNPSTTSSSQIADLMLTYISPFFAVVGFVSLINILFNVKAFNLLADKSKVPLFRTAAKVLLAGGFVAIGAGIIFAMLATYGLLSFNTLMIIAVPGGLVQDVAWLLLAMSFFRISVPPTSTLVSSSNPTFEGQLRYCSVPRGKKQ